MAPSAGGNDLPLLAVVNTRVRNSFANKTKICEMLNSFFIFDPFPEGGRNVNACELSWNCRMVNLELRRVRLTKEVNRPGRRHDFSWSEEPREIV